MPTEALEQAYRSTTYRVFLPGGALDLRIGQASAELAGWLAKQGATCWAVLTACNPLSCRCSVDENDARQSRLMVELLERGYEPYVGENLADAGDWPAEENCLVAGLSVTDCLALAQRFGQNAVVCGGSDGVPQLIWVECPTQ